MFLDIVIYIYLFLASLVLLGYMYKYALILLLLIELVVVNISLIMFMMFGIINMEFYMIYYLVFSVCEGVLGLGILVILARFTGEDLYFMFNVSKF